MKRGFFVFSAALMAVVIPASQVVAGPVSIPTQPLEGLTPVSPPVVTAEAWLLWDDTFQRELGSLLPDQARAMASTTKMMTAIVALATHDLDERVRISATATAIGESEIELVAGEVWRLEDLIRALLIRSANDAALAIAEHVGGSEAQFVRMMNDMAAELGLQNTHFMNPHGLDEEGHFSSARDLLSIARVGMENVTFAEFVGTRSSTFPISPTGEERVAATTNALLSTFEGAIGVKTGYPADAGLTVVSAAERDGRRLYAVVLGSADHFADAAALLRYGFDAFGLLSVIAEGESIASQRGPNGVSDAVAITDLNFFASATDDVDLVLGISEEGAPIVVAELGDEEIGRVALEVADAQPLPGIGEAFAWASAYWDWMWGND